MGLIILFKSKVVDWASNVVYLILRPKSRIILPDLSRFSQQITSSLTPPAHFRNHHQYLKFIPY